MTFRSQLTWRILVMITSLVIISGVALWGLNAVRQDYSAAIAGYENLRALYEIGAGVSTARKLMYLDHPDAHAMMREIQSAAARLEQFSPKTDSARMPQLRADARQQLIDAQTQLWAIITAGGTPDISPMSGPLDQTLRIISDISTEIRQGIQRRQDAAARKRRTVLYTTAGLCGLLVLAAVLVGLSHYRTVMRPLRRLNRTVHELAQGRLDRRVDTSGPEEFARLATDFNTMADELDTLYRQLEQKVAEKSRALVRSERLASVGYLAAGVAHEINNPIGIIAGHAELALQQGGAQPPDSALAEAREALRVIAEEAFRCKEIVQRLLSLARPGDTTRRPLELPALVREVIQSLAALKDHRGRSVEFQAPADRDYRVLASEGEIKQVLLNLLINALEATEPASGRVTVSLRHGANDEIELAVSDNGRGMTPEVLDRVFEPFFTAKRGSGRPGTGLGLSISHAIIAGHGGRLEATSDGPGAGSRFALYLPALKEHET